MKNMENEPRQSHDIDFFAMRLIRLWTSFNQLIYFKNLLKLRETSWLKREAYKTTLDIPRANQMTLELRVLEFSG